MRVEGRAQDKRGSGFRVGFRVGGLFGGPNLPQSGGISLRSRYHDFLNTKGGKKETKILHFRSTNRLRPRSSRCGNCARICEGRTERQRLLAASPKKPATLRRDGRRCLREEVAGICRAAGHFEPERALSRCSPSDLPPLSAALGKQSPLLKLLNSVVAALD